MSRTGCGRRPGDLADDAGVAGDADAVADRERLIVVEVSGGDDLVAAASLIRVHARAREYQKRTISRRENPLRYRARSRAHASWRSSGHDSAAGVVDDLDVVPVRVKQR